MIDCTTKRLLRSTLAILSLLLSPCFARAHAIATVAASPSNLALGATEVVVSLAGNGTQWTPKTTFKIKGGLGARIAEQKVTDATHAILIVYPDAQAGSSLLTLSEDTDAAVVTLTVDAPETTSQVVYSGDSLTRGENASRGLGIATGTTYPGMLAAALGPAWKVTNVGTGGWTIDQMSAEAADKVDVLYRDDYANNILIIFAGTNNIGGARQSADDVYAKLTAYCATRKAAHPWKILIVTAPVAAYPKVYPRNFDDEMLKYDALMRANWPHFADGLIDVQSDSRLGIPGDEFNPVYFNDKDYTP